MDEIQKNSYIQYQKKAPQKPSKPKNKLANIFAKNSFVPDPRAQEMREKLRNKYEKKIQKQQPLPLLTKSVPLKKTQVKGLQDSDFFSKLPHFIICELLKDCPIEQLIQMRPFCKKINSAVLRILNQNALKWGLQEIKDLSDGVKFFKQLFLTIERMPHTKRMVFVHLPNDRKIQIINTEQTKQNFKNLSLDGFSKIFSQEICYKDCEAFHSFMFKIYEKKFDHSLNSNHSALLTLAVDNKAITCLRLFSKVYVNPNFYTYRSIFFLSQLIYERKFEIAKEFLNFPTIDPHRLSGNSSSPLCFAAQAGWDEGINILIENHKAKVDEKGEEHNTPLMWAVESGSLSTIKLLIEKKADVSVLNNNHPSFLYRAFMSKKMGLFSLLLENGANPYDPFLIYEVILSGHVEALELMRSYKIDINQLIGGTTPLIVACQKKKLSVVKELLEWKADPNMTDIDLESPLGYAVQTPCFDIVIFLIENKANIDHAGKWGPPLCLAVENKQRKNVKILLENGAKWEGLDFEKK